MSGVEFVKWSYKIGFVIYYFSHHYIIKIQSSWEQHLILTACEVNSLLMYEPHSFIT